MADGFIRVPVDSAGKRVDAEELTVGGQVVERQRIILSDPVAPAGHTRIKNVQPDSGDYGLVVRQAPAGLLEAIVDFATSGNHNVIAALGAGIVVKIWKLVLWSNGAQALSIRDGATPLMGVIDLAQGGQFKLDRDADPWFTLTANSPFNLNTDQAQQLSGRVYYTQG